MATYNDIAQEICSAANHETNWRLRARITRILLDHFGAEKAAAPAPPVPQKKKVAKKAKAAGSKLFAAKQ